MDRLYYSYTQNTRDKAMIIRTTYNHNDPNMPRETIRYEDGDRTNPKNFLRIHLWEDGKIRLSINSRQLAYASRGVRRRLQPWLCKEFGGVPGQKRWTVTEQQLQRLLLSPVVDITE